MVRGRIKTKAEEETEARLDREGLAALVGGKVEQVRIQQGVYGKVPVLLVRLQDGALVEVGTLSDEEGNGDGVFSLDLREVATAERPRRSRSKGFKPVDLSEIGTLPADQALLTFKNEVDTEAGVPAGPVRIYWSSSDFKAGKVGLDFGWRARIDAIDIAHRHAAAFVEL